MRHNSLHLLFKFHEEGQGEFEGRKTMEEHIYVDREKGKVVWGHFTSNPKLKGLWDKKMKLIEDSLRTYGVAFVFFSDKENELLYVAKFIDSYKRDEVEKTHPIVEFVPEYYHHKVGTPSKLIADELRSYAYVEMSDIKQIAFDKVDMIYTDKEDVLEPVLDNKGMSSKFYVTVHNDLFDELEDMFKSEQRKGLSYIDLETILEEDYQTAVENILQIEDEIIDEKKTNQNQRK